MTFAVEPRHRRVLEARTYLGKVALPTHQAYVNPEDLRAVLELSAAKLIECIDTKVQLTWLPLGILCDVYKTTIDGELLCQEHKIEMLDP